MPKFSPSPWHTGTDEDAHIVYDKDAMFVADVLTDDGDADIELANAQLIAAAPDLLAVLKAVHPAFCAACCPNVWKTADRQPHEKLCEEIRAVIAKAEQPTN